MEHNLYLYCIEKYLLQKLLNSNISHKQNIDIDFETNFDIKFDLNLYKNKASFLFIYDNNRRFFDDENEYSKTISFYEYTNIHNKVSKQITYLKFRKIIKPLKKGDIPSYIKKINFDISGSLIDYDNLKNFIPDEGIIPYGVKTLNLGYCFSNELKPKFIPNTVEHLYMGESYNHPLKVGDIPYGVKYLFLSEDFNHPLIKDVIPNSVIYLEFGKSFNQTLKIGDIPNSVEQLIFGTNFDKPLKKGIIPNSVKYLILSNFREECDICNSDFYDFNQPLEIGSIPDSVKHLTFGKCFNQPLKKGIIPNGVTHITFKGDFNQPLEKGSIPDSVVSLIFTSFNKPLVPGILPNSITYLDLGQIFNEPLYPNSLPNNLTYLNLGSLKPNLYTNFLPKIAKILSLYSTNELLVENIIPQNVITLNINEYYDSFTDILPKSLINLTVKSTKPVNIKKGDLPNGLKKLELYLCDVLCLFEEVFIPETVEHLVIRCNINGNKFNENTIPKNVKYLNLDILNLNQPILNIIPNSVEKLILKNTYMSNLIMYDEIKFDNNLLPNLLYLDINIDSFRLFDIKNLPEKLLYLKIEMDNDDDHIYICEITDCYGKYLINDKFLFCYQDVYYVIEGWFKKIPIYIDSSAIDKFENFIDNLIYKFKSTKSILKELTEKIFHPNRLLKMCKTYNIEFDELMEYY